MVGVFTGVAKTCASLFGSGLFLGVGECALLFAGDGEPPVSGGAGVVCNEPLDLLLFTTCLPGGEEGKEWTEFCLCSGLLVTEEGLLGGGVFSVSLDGGRLGEDRVLLGLCDGVGGIEEVYVLTTRGSGLLRKKKK